MNQLTANPPKRAKKKVQPLVPMVKVGDCVFAAKGKVSFVKATNLPAQRELASILIAQGMVPTEKSARSLGVTVKKQKKNGILLFLTDPERNDCRHILESAMDKAELSELPSNVRAIQGSLFGPGTHRKNLTNFLDENPKSKLLIILEGNKSTNLHTQEDAPGYMEFLGKTAQKYGIAIVLIFNQFVNSLRQGKNGPYLEKAQTRTFAVAKLTYEGGPGFYRLESCRAPKGHDFWPISVSLDTDQTILHHQGIERNRVPVPNQMFVAC